MLDGSEDARMVPMLPCGDIDEMAAFWTSLGLAVTYPRLRPNPYLALGRNAIDLSLADLPGLSAQDERAVAQAAREVTEL